MSEPEDVVAKQGIIDKLLLLHALWNIHLGLMMQVDRIKDLISIIEGMDISYSFAMLPILGSITGTVSSALCRSTEKSRESEEVQASEEPMVPSAPVNPSCGYSL